MTKSSQLSSIAGLVLLSFFQGRPSSAQGFNYAAAANRAVSTQSFNMQMRMMNNLQMMNMARWSYKDNMFTNNKLVFDLVLNNDESREVKSKIYIDTTLRKTYILVVDKSLDEKDPKREQKLYPADIKSINIKRGTFEGTFMPKLTTDSCWMFRVIDGEINVYSNALAIVALQKHDGPLLPFTKANLETMVSDDPKAKKFFDKQDFVKAINKYNSNHEKPQDDNSTD